MLAASHAGGLRDIDLITSALRHRGPDAGATFSTRRQASRSGIGG